MNAIDFTNQQDQEQEQLNQENSRIEVEEAHDMEDRNDDSAKGEQEAGLDGEEGFPSSPALGNPMIENSDDPNDDLNPLYKVGGHFE